MREETQIKHIVISLNKEGEVVYCKSIKNDEFLTSFEKLPAQIKESRPCIESETIKIRT